MTMSAQPSTNKGQSVTALQDLLSISPVSPKSVREFVCAPLRGVLPGRQENEEHPYPRLIRPGIERC
jgi:hypothetical protein